MGDTKMGDEDLVDYNDVDPDGRTDGKLPPLDWNFNEAHEKLSKSGDS